ncbi:MAG: arginine--tRNA ligase [Betaproteobacteria bacterium]|nr:arginine--tRNA ligase [Betaproteobacteria bacterium]MDE1956472.1 arginine--tRNA ligase [Betaproteobacteria bacterium]MDE2152644.1 arginine--tRNA ligase [Betaproteobacteria bacterium]
MRDYLLRLNETLAAAATRLLAPGESLGAATLLERPKAAGHGDFSCTLALQLARRVGRNPRDIGQLLLQAVQAEAELAAGLQSASLAGPGFVNFTLAPALKHQVLRQVLGEGEAYGREAVDPARRVLVEFVSANPTGPLHVGHGRQGALGDTLAELMATQGWAVSREFYYNDAGVQIGNLALSVQARARGLAPGQPGWPEAAYNGEYIADIARDYLAGASVQAADGQAVRGAGEVDDLEAIRAFAVAYLRREQDIDLKAFGIAFDNYYLESSLYADGRVHEAVHALVTAGHTYEADGALWLRSTEFGDDKDRVMRKSDGSYTYFVPDVAYHLAKWERGFHHAVNIQGSDHHGTIARVRAGLRGADPQIPQDYPQYVLHKMVTVMRGGQEVKISKRAGSYVTLRDLIEWSGGVREEQTPEEREAALRRGRDAVRFFLVSRKADTEFVFDVDLALAQSDDNPVYYVQYAHARICSVLAQWAERDGGQESQLAGCDLSPLDGPREMELLMLLAQYPDMLRQAAADLSPHDVAFYLRQLAGSVHSYYNAERVLVDDPALKHARLALLLAVRQVLHNALCVLGVSSPQRM